MLTSQSRKQVNIEMDDSEMSVSKVDCKLKMLFLELTDGDSINYKAVDLISGDVIQDLNSNYIVSVDGQYITSILGPSCQFGGCDPDKSTVVVERNFYIIQSSGGLRVFKTILNFKKEFEAKNSYYDQAKDSMGTYNQVPEWTISERWIDESKYEIDLDANKLNKNFSKIKSFKITCGPTPKFACIEN